MNWMIWRKTFNMKLMSLYLKIKKLLTVMKKVVLIMMPPVEEQIPHNTFRVTQPNLINISKWKNFKGNKADAYIN